MVVMCRWSVGSVSVSIVSLACSYPACAHLRVPYTRTHPYMGFTQICRMCSSLCCRVSSSCSCEQQTIFTPLATRSGRTWKQRFGRIRTWMSFFRPYRTISLPWRGCLAWGAKITPSRCCTSVLPTGRKRRIHEGPAAADIHTSEEANNIEIFDTLTHVHSSFAAIALSHPWVLAGPT